MEFRLFLTLAFLSIAPASASPDQAPVHEPHNEALSVEIDSGRFADTLSETSFQALSEKARERGNLPVIVDLEAGPLGGEMDTHAISMNQQLVLDRLDANRDKYRIKRRYTNIASVALYVGEAALETLASLGNVVRITEDTALSPTLDYTTVITGAMQVHGSGYSGSGLAIAIIDTGVERNHPFLHNKVIYEHCFSTNDDEYVSTCPNGEEEDDGAGSARPCDYHNSCYHGTHVAGIAAGSAADKTYTGVAPGAKIIAINVFSRPRSGGGVLATYSDINAGLDAIYSLRNVFDIAAVNMSLGTGRHSQHCDSAYSNTKSIIDSLRASKIFTTISSGNNFYKDGINAPACVSSAISVGNTLDNGTVNPSSNSAYILDVLAPGTSVQSSYLAPGLVPTYQSLTGTSMAAPHVAGAIALIKEKQPTWTADQIEDALTSHGPLITDTNGIARRRLDVAAILNPVPLTVVSYTFQGCTPSGAKYLIHWSTSNGVPVELWSAQVQYNEDGGPWYGWYSGTDQQKVLYVNGGSKQVRVRGKSGLQWGEFQATQVYDFCPFITAEYPH